MAGVISAVYVWRLRRNSTVITRQLTFTWPLLAHNLPFGQKRTAAMNVLYTGVSIRTLLPISAMRTSTASFKSRESSTPHPNLHQEHGPGRPASSSVVTCLIVTTISFAAYCADKLPHCRGTGRADGLWREISASLLGGREGRCIPMTKHQHFTKEEPKRSIGYDPFLCPAVLWVRD